MQEVNENHSRRAFFCTTAIHHTEWNGNYNYFIFCIVTLPMLHSAKKNGLKKQRNRLYLCHKVICESYEINDRWHLKISIVNHDTKESVQKNIFIPNLWYLRPDLIFEILSEYLTLYLLNYVHFYYYPHSSSIFITYKGKQKYRL